MTQCDISQDCLACPLPQCHADLPGGIGQARRQLSTLNFYRVVYEEDLSPEEAAIRFRIKPRTVYRRLKLARSLLRLQEVS